MDNFTKYMRKIFSFGFEKVKNHQEVDKKLDIDKQAPIEKDNSHKDMPRSEFTAHKELHEGITPEPVSETMKKHHIQMKECNVNVHKMGLLLADEYQVLLRMDFSKEEIESELERRILQLIPRKR